VKYAISNISSRQALRAQLTFSLSVAQECHCCLLEITKYKARESESVLDFAAADKALDFLCCKYKPVAGFIEMTRSARQVL